MATLSRSIRSAMRQRLIRNDRRVKTELVREGRAVGLQGVRHMQRVVDNWEHEPQFGSDVIVRANLIRVTIYPKGQHKQIFLYVDKGTKPHLIRARRADGWLVFQTGHRAKTALIAKYDQGDGGRDGAWVKTREVNHPGTEARLFSETLADDLRPELNRGIDNAIRRGLRRG